MTIDEIIEVIHDEARRQGEPLTRDVCRHIAMRLFYPNVVHLKPGEIARKHRERYED
jgi:hypothetical protein